MFLIIWNDKYIGPTYISFFSLILAFSVPWKKFFNLNFQSAEAVPSIRAQIEVESRLFSGVPTSSTSHVAQVGMGPVELSHRMTAELARLEAMEESMRQLSAMERTRAVGLSQTETVSLAQILKVGGILLPGLVDS